MTITDWPEQLSNEGWRKTFKGGEIYRGTGIKQMKDGRWWAWTGHSMGTSASEEDAKRAVDVSLMSGRELQEEARKRRV